MGTELSGLQAFAFYDPSTGDTVQVDAKYVDTFDFSQARGGEDGPTNPTGGQVATGDFSEVVVEFTDVGDKAQLEQWRANDTPLSFVAAGEQAAIQWYEQDALSELQELPVFDEHANLNRLRARLTRSGHGIHNIYKGTNLLRPVNHQEGAGFLASSWRDNDGDGLADGYALGADAETPSFASGTGHQSFVVPSDGNAAFLTLVSDLVFPLPGVELTLSASFVDLYSDNDTINTDDQIRALSQNYSRTQLKDSSTTFDTIGRFGVTWTLPDNTYSLQLRVHDLQGASKGSDVTITQAFPALRLDGSTEHASY